MPANKFNIKKVRSLYMPKILLVIFAAFFYSCAYSQVTFPVNGIAEPSEGSYAFTNATIYKNAQQVLNNATLLIRNKKIVDVGAAITIPKDAVVINCKGKYIYPSFIDLYSDYGITAAPIKNIPVNYNNPPQLTSNNKGAYGWNQAIKSEVNAVMLFDADDSKAKPLREAGFGTVLTHSKDGIARGTGAVVTLAGVPDNFAVIKDKASAHYSLNKGSSTQSYPTSVMGSIALLRQTYLDARWYKSRPSTEGTNLSLQAWNNNQSLPQIFEGNDKWGDIRADRIGDEFGVQYIIKAGGNEYQRISEITSTHASYILPLNFPQAMDVDDPNDARFVSLSDLKHWEMAPSNLAAFQNAHIPFCITPSDLQDTKLFMANMRKAIEAGLSEETALDALTKIPASLLGLSDTTGSLDRGKLANFLITSGPLFNEKTTIIQNWVQGEKYIIKNDAWINIAGTYNLAITDITGTRNYILDVKNSSAANVIDKDTLTTKFSYDGKFVKINFSPVALARKHKTGGDTTIIIDTTKILDSTKVKAQPRIIDPNKTDSFPEELRPLDDRMPEKEQNQAKGYAPPGGKPLPPGNIGPAIRLSGVSNDKLWQGSGVDTSGNMLTWTATFIEAAIPAPDTAKKKNPFKMGRVTYPFNGYGWQEMPKQEDMLIKNATVWTNEKEGILNNTDVLVRKGKIIQVSKNLSYANAKIIDGTGKYLTPGIIDEHSHIAAASINEGAQSVTSEVRIGDNLDPEDIDIYRQLAGGVTTAHILHGSANTIGGQTQLIKLRWGSNDSALKFAGADPFIKFALGENVKRSTTINNSRFPDTRMGVEEVLMDAFTRAKDYEKVMNDTRNNNGKNKTINAFRRDLELDALAEILNKKRFITCHSYVQSEITAAIRIGEKFGFRFNTFTHILEGYKVADKMKLHGANASTFSDWWNYKMEVIDAIPQNAGIMHSVGINVAINSDDPEMARRLNQEAAKSIKYAGMSEEDAFKMVTLNPAIMLHIADRTGSIKAGKDADLVLWTDNPLSIYARAGTTIVDGIIYYDMNKDKLLRKNIKEERNRLIQKMSGEKKAGLSVLPVQASAKIILRCEDD